MTAKHSVPLVLAALMAVGLISPVRGQQPTVQIPNPGVPQVMTLEAKFVRVAYNNECYVIMGYQMAQRSLGEEWMLIETGFTLLGNTPDYKLTRAALSLETPDGKTLPLPSVTEFRAADTEAVQKRSKVQRDSIDYFQPGVSRASRLGFFSDLSDRAMPWDEVELSNTRAALGRLYFRIPGGIKYGQHWLNVKFAKSVIRVPFRILTEDEEKMLSKNYRSISKQIEEAFKPKKKK